MRFKSSIVGCYNVNATSISHKMSGEINDILEHIMYQVE